ncbi:glycohydrolase toxin TNT-related protein [Actinokineospora sp.]|uniref:glycohydrolase toxin TNT-related protein n=1 Tax=Actinokineospora sp. TaxID=1872133 RepID=UPI003D6A9492
MAQPTQLNPTEQDALVKQIGLALLRAAPADWHSITVDYRALGRYAEAVGKVIFADETTEELKVSPEIAVLFGRLRSGMYRDGRGTWYNARYQLDQPSAYSLEYDRDEPRWTNPPPPPAYADDLRTFPRDEQNVPEWLMRRMAGLMPPFRVARIFDGPGAGGRPVINRPPIDEGERENILRYLDGAPLALPARGFDTDHLDDEARQSVPVAFHTDGAWIWPAAVNYYLRTHSVPPDPDLLEHLRRVEFTLPEVDESARAAAGSFLGRGPRRPPNGVRPAPAPAPAPVPVPAPSGPPPIMGPDGPVPPIPVQVGFGNRAKPPVEEPVHTTEPIDRTPATSHAPTQDAAPQRAPETTAAWSPTHAPSEPTGTHATAPIEREVESWFPEPASDSAGAGASAVVPSDPPPAFDWSAEVPASSPGSWFPTESAQPEPEPEPEAAAPADEETPAADAPSWAGGVDQGQEEDEHGLPAGDPPSESVAGWSNPVPEQPQETPSSEPVADAAPSSAAVGADAVSTPRVPVAPGVAARFDQLQARLSTLGVPESRYRIGALPESAAWVLEQSDEGWRVGWFDGGFSAPRQFEDFADASAFLLGKVLLEPVEPPQSTMRASLAELEDDDDDEYEHRPRRSVTPPAPAGDDLFRPSRPADDLFRPQHTNFTATGSTPVFDDDEDEDEYQHRRAAPRPTPRLGARSADEPDSALSLADDSHAANDSAFDDGHTAAEVAFDERDARGAAAFGDERSEPFTGGQSAEDSAFTESATDSGFEQATDGQAFTDHQQAAEESVDAFGSRPLADGAHGPGDAAFEGDHPADDGTFADRGAPGFEDRQSVTDGTFDGRPASVDDGVGQQPNTDAAFAGREPAAANAESAPGSLFTRADTDPDDAPTGPLERFGDHDGTTASADHRPEPEGGDFGAFEPRADEEPAGDLVSPHDTQFAAHTPGDTASEHGTHFASEPAGDATSAYGAQFGGQPANDTTPTPDPHLRSEPSDTASAHGSQFRGEPVGDAASAHGAQFAGQTTAETASAHGAPFGRGQTAGDTAPVGGGQFGGGDSGGGSRFGGEPAGVASPRRVGGPAAGGGQQTGGGSSSPGSDSVVKPQDWAIQPLPGDPPLTLFRGKTLTELPPGTEIDRYGEPTGNLTYAAGTPFERRSLVPDWVSRPYRVYRVQRPTEALTGVAIPWFEQPGGGTAFVFNRSIAELIESGHLVEIPNQVPPTRP